MSINVAIGGGFSIYMLTAIAKSKAVTWLSCNTYRQNSHCLSNTFKQVLKMKSDIFGKVVLNLLYSLET